ncbi:acyltransferase family protein [Streptomyces physcomitrii]|uniref:Acyltransferase n=1 Tax=Streptomyces physcomitrii TaxID=2724184 RepID=A0ABX1GX13_9ACTN|nr:acyltransferase [Streptomyces physcomitrii]NKI40327.1 acyltransferase [Streptomyces physcomitrii]
MGESVEETRAPLPSGTSGGAGAPPVSGVAGGAAGAPSASGAAGTAAGAAAPPGSTAGGAGVADTARGYAPAVDGLRALAALLVVSMHVGIFTGQVPGLGEEGPLGPVLSGFAVAVPIFFVISGLLLYRPWAEAALDGRRAPHTGRYYWHRLLRVVPAYWLAALTALLLFERERLDEAGRTTRILLLQVIYERDSLTMSLSQTWSLATEVSYYALLPLLALALHRLLARGRTGAALALLGALVLLSVVWVAVLYRDPLVQEPVARLWLPAYAGYFAAGMALALLAARTARAARPPRAAELVRRYPWACWLLALAAQVVVSTPLAGDVAAIPSSREVVVEHLCHLLTAAGLAAPLLLADGSAPARLLGSPLPAWLGRISYGVFLWHMVVIVGWLEWTDKQLGTLDIGDFAVLYPLTLAVSVILGWLSYALVERPLRRLR